MLDDIKKAIQIISPLLFTTRSSPRITAAILLMLSSTTFNFVAAFILSEMIKIDSAHSDRDTDYFNVTIEELTSAFIAAVILSRALQSSRRILTNPLISNTAFSLVLELNKHFMSLSHSYFAQAAIGSISEHFTTGSTGAQDFTAQLFNQIIPVTIESIAASVIAFLRFGLYEGLTFSGMFVLYIAYNFLVARPIATAQKETVKTRGEMTRTITSTLQNYETIQLFNNATTEMSKVDQKLALVKEANTYSLSLPDMIAMGQLLIIGSGFLALLLISPNIPLNEFVGLCFYLLLFINLFSGFGDGISKAHAACINLSQVATIFEKVSDIPDFSPMSTLNAKNASLEFNEVSFCYDSRKGDVLKKLSFKVNPGEKVGIVGTSGAGKSTIARLLYRFYDYQNGNIKVNGEEINTVSLSALRGSIAVVPQSTILFNGSLADNIWYGAIAKHGNQIQNDMLQKAIVAADLDEYINSLPDKLQTTVGERSAKISGGQAQRVAIARALLKEAPIMIFDEATSALDQKTEETVQKSLTKASQGKTTLIISHKLYNVKDADRIIVLKNGEKIEEGTHDELMQKQGAYFEMWQKQSKEYNSSSDSTKNDFSTNSTNNDDPQEEKSKSLRPSLFRRDRLPAKPNDDERTALLSTDEGSINNGNTTPGFGSEK